MVLLSLLRAPFQSILKESGQNEASEKYLPKFHLQEYYPSLLLPHNLNNETDYGIQQLSTKKKKKY
jgi:hypothetical protein